MKMVIIKADKDSKAFSVGGDVKAVVNDQDSNLRDIFFREVYILNNLIGEFFLCAVQGKIVFPKGRVDSSKEKVRLRCLVGST